MQNKKHNTTECNKKQAERTNSQLLVGRWKGEGQYRGMDLSYNTENTANILQKL